VNQPAQIIWDALDFRMPAVLRVVEPLSEGELRWQPPSGANSIGWLLWHIPEVEDNWVRDRLLGLPRRFPFGKPVREALPTEYPEKAALLAYLREVRDLSRDRLERTTTDDLQGTVSDKTWGTITVGQLWSGVATSCAWHGGQIVLIANRLLPRMGAETKAPR
jgi:uncharacterized damage-inducible protein DinB